MTKTTAEKVAQELLAIKAVQINMKQKFTWASGIKAPIYTDNRLITGFVKSRNMIANQLAALIKKQFPKAEIIIGTATAGITHALYAAHYLNLPMGYVRANIKKHGMQNQIEGVEVKNKQVVIIEDLFSTGASVLKVAQILQVAQAQILGIVSIFTYQLPQLAQNLADFKYYSLTNLETLLNVAQVKNYLTANEKKEIQQFKANL